MRRARPWLLALLAVSSTAVLASPGAASGTEGVHGIAGIADARAVIDFDDLLSAMDSRRASALAPVTGRRGSLHVRGVITSTDPSAPDAATTTEASPIASPSFKALGDDGTSIPPDTNGAVGPNHVMTALNTQVRIQNRTGNTISTKSLAAFWASVDPPHGAEPDVFDPRMVFDPYGSGGGRFILVTLDDPAESTSSILIGVSQTSDPTGQWNLYRFDAEATNQNWADFPSVGFNKNWIVVQVNVFTNANDQFVRGDVYAFDKLNLYGGGAGAFTRFPDPDTFSDAPAVTYDPTQETAFLVQTVDGSSQGKGILRMSSISGPVGAPVFTPEVALPSTTNTWADIPNAGGTDFAPQKGTSRRIQVNDSGILGCVYRNGSIWCAHTIFLPVSSPNRSSIQWWQLAPDGTVQQRVRIDDPGGGHFYGFPSITVNSQSDVLVGFSSFSAQEYASAAFAFQAGTDPRGTMRDVAVLKAGEAPYYKTFGGGFNRWGDFSATGVDPVKDLDMWTLQEYAGSPAAACGQNCWGTWWGRVTPPPSQPNPGTLQLNSASYAVNEAADFATITVSRVGGSSGQVTVDYTTSAGTATPGSDYDDVSGTLTFGDGVVTQTFAVPILDDSSMEPDETVQITLSNPQGGATLGSPSTAILKILDANVVSYRPDLRIKRPSGSYVGNNVYNRTGGHQTKKATATPGSKRRFSFIVENDGASQDRIRVTGSGNSAGFRVRYLENGSPLSSADGSLDAAVVLLPGQRITYPVKIVVTVLKGASSGRVKTITITARSPHGARDVAKARVRVA